MAIKVGINGFGRIGRLVLQSLALRAARNRQVAFVGALARFRKSVSLA
jgi:glyceraldehyde-3-phosphate dehydrogenase/erythrose-4-phosphate dehydrogenase